MQAGFGYNLWKGNNPNSKVEGSTLMENDLQIQREKIPKDKYYRIIENEILIITKIVNSKTGVTTPLIKKQYNLDAKSAAFDIANDLSEKIFNHLQEDKVKNNR